MRSLRADRDFRGYSRCSARDAACTVPPDEMKSIVLPVFLITAALGGSALGGEPAPASPAGAAALPVPVPRVTAAAGGAIVAPPAPTCDEEAARWRRVGFVTAAAFAGLGLGLTISAAVIQAKLDKVADSVSDVAGATACAGGRAAAICEETRTAQEVRDGLSGAGFIALAAAATVGGVTIGSLWWAPSERASAPVRVVPMVDPKRAGVAFVTVW